MSTPRLPPEAISTLLEAAQKLALDRDALVAGINPTLVAGLPRFNAPASQIYADLHTLNCIERLVDNTDPLRQWLLNAKTLAAAREEAAIFVSCLLQLLDESDSSHDDTTGLRARSRRISPQARLSKWNGSSKSLMAVGLGLLLVAIGLRFVVFGVAAYTGQVFDSATGVYVSKADLVLEGTNCATRTDDSGYFRLTCPTRTTFWLENTTITVRPPGSAIACNGVPVHWLRGTLVYLVLSSESCSSTTRIATDPPVPNQIPSSTPTGDPTTSPTLNHTDPTPKTSAASPPSAGFGVLEVTARRPGCDFSVDAVDSLFAGVKATFNAVPAGPRTITCKWLGKDTVSTRTVEVFPQKGVSVYFEIPDVASIYMMAAFKCKWSVDDEYLGEGDTASWKGFPGTHLVKCLSTFATWEYKRAVIVAPGSLQKVIFNVGGR